MRSLRFVPAVGGLFALVLVSGGCGVPDEGPARIVDSDDVPFRLLQGRATTSGPARTEQVATGPAVYFTSADRLVRLGIPDPGGLLPRLAGALGALSAGPTPLEQQRGLGTAIPAGLQLRATSVIDGRAEIDLRGDVAHPGVGQNVMTAGQIVLTATSVPGVDRVVLTRLGEPVVPVLPHGDLAAGPVKASDYAWLVRAGPSAAKSPAP
jgi:hypothetical protein